MAERKSPPGLTADIQAAIQASQPRDLEELQLLIRSVADSYNNVPSEDLGGLSPNQVQALTRPGWLGHAVECSADLDAADLQPSLIYVNARTLLRAIQEQGEVNATATGAFNRKLVQQMAAEMRFKGIDSWIVERGKTLNQRDVQYVDLFRHLLPAAGLLLYRKGKFRVTRKAHDYLGEDAAGRLQRLLFETLMTRINLGYRDRLPDFSDVQHTIGYSLYRIHQLATDWTEMNALSYRILLPYVIERIPKSSILDEVVSFAYLRVVRNLGDFGLMETRSARRFGPPDAIRKTPLYDRFLRFHLPQVSTRHPTWGRASSTEH